ncbi:MAG TPA: Gfo/Idh/MocA family oxidoreductase [Chitinophagaceae bacterium]|nr:Gfo/Idh/MocA family oxidoreductase [Chitinophagaceae bacterium]HPH30898.1 Gfo/Idh/MocA family oxidoreductase [Chitinophagaceae bacterium]
MMKSLHLLFILVVSLNAVKAQTSAPLHIGVIGLTHTHVHWIFNSEKRGEITIAGIVEPNKELAMRYAQQYQFPLSKLYNSIEELVTAQKPEAVAAFGTIAEHLKVVETCAPLGIHVMVEKPLALNVKEAIKMQSLAARYNIHLLVNYETTWYPTVHKADELLQADSVGSLVQLIIRDGHRGPKEIGVNKEFLDWLIDPVQNGGGAITDFGCYGANIATWMLRGKRPLSVTAVTQQLQRQNNPLVDDEATIILLYEDCKVIIQPSWNWPIGRKDMEVYGRRGVIYADNRHDLRVRMAKGYDGFTETTERLPEQAAPYDDPFAFFAAVIKKKVVMQPYDLSSFENNLLVMEILDAARKSAKSGKTVKLKKGRK